MTSRDIGLNYEKTAQHYLKSNGVHVLTANFHSPYGEVDIIGREGKQNLLFIEVRYRKSSAYGSPAETITRSKRLKIIKTAQFYLQKYPKYNAYGLRFDVVAISGTQGEDIEWLKDAFAGDGQ